MMFFPGCADESRPDEELPWGLPFTLQRDAEGDPLSDEEIAAFTKKITGFWKEVDYFNWLTRHAHGIDESLSMPDYWLYWQDTQAEKQGDKVTYVHVNMGGSDNIAKPTPKFMNQLIAGYLTFEDPTMGRLIEQYSKGLVALFLGMVYENEDPVIDWLMARSIFTTNHDFTTPEGRAAAVDYDPIQREQLDWNSHSLNNPDNPYWGDLWLRNMRSKDDVPHLLRLAPLLQRVARDGADQGVREAAERLHHYLTRFAQDIVDSGYLIRTKDDQGNPFIPVDEENPEVVKDLASLVSFESYIPNAECNAKLATALFAYGEPLGNDCGDGISPQYEVAAVAAHFFNYPLIRYFHLAAIVQALMRREDRAAKRLLDGLIQRAEDTVNDKDGYSDHFEWYSERASFLLAAATCGLPLTAREARIIQEEYALSVDFYLPWPNWDLWDPALPDGTYETLPPRGDETKRNIRIAEMAYFLEYCYSPWRNPAGAEVVDCAIVMDPTQWGR